MDETKKVILVVDDESINRLLLKKTLENEYEILEAANGQEAIEIVQKRETDISVILLDLVMPVMDGFGVMKFMNEFGYILAIPVIAITVDNTMENEKQTFELGVSDFIAKPFRPEIVKKRVRNIVDLFERSNCLMALVEEQTAEIYAESERLQEHMQQQMELQQRNNEILLDGLSSLVEFRYHESGSHAKHVKEITELLFRRLIEAYPNLKIDDEDIEAVIKAAGLHDIGKIAIPDQIILKEGTLTPEEFEVMKLHCKYGVDILKKFEEISDKKFLKYAINICGLHHERIDGKGYPEHLTGDKIPIYVQIVSMADVYDTLVSKRVYREPFSHDTAMKMILEGECGAFSDAIKKILVDARNDLKKLYE